MARVETKLASLYPIRGEKPFSSPRIDYRSRVMALRQLIHYHHATFLDSNALASSDDPFLNIIPFLQTLRPDPGIDEYSLAHFFSDRKPGREDLVLINKTRALMDTLSINDVDRYLATCTYRTVSAVSRATVEIADKDYVVGAAGYSGGHEFLFAPPGIQKKLLVETLCEALIVGGFPLVSNQEEGLIREIREEAYRLIEERSRRQPYARSPNCVDFSNLATTGAKNIAQRHGEKVVFTKPFAACFMHKHNPRYKSAYEAVGLPLPGEFGRLRCISSCAETQALIRTDYAVNLAVFLGEQESYLLDVKRGNAVIPDFPMKTTSEYLYLVDQHGKIQLKRAIIDRDLTWNPHEEKQKHSLYWLYPQLRRRGIDPNRYAELFLVQKGDFIVVSGFAETTKLRKIEVEMKEYIPIAIIPLSDISRVPVPKVSGQELETSAPPCIYCAHQIDKRDVEHVHIERIDWAKIKADDALALEYLMTQFRGRVTVS